MENVTRTYLTTYFEANYTANDLSDDNNNQMHVYYAYILHVFVAVILSVVAFLGMMGNGLVIWITGFRMKKTVTTVWFLNLAIADFISTSVLPLFIITFALGLHWPFGTFMCKFANIIAVLNLFASVLLLTVISIDRCISVMLPLWCLNHRTIRRASVIAIAVWLLSFCGVPFVAFINTHSFNNHIHCIIIFPTISLHVTFTMIVFIFGFFIPFIIIASCYTVIALKLHKNPNYKSSKTFKIIIAILVAFAVCWLPYHVFNFLFLFGKIYNDSYLSAIVLNWHPIVFVLLSINSCINPFLYVIIGRDYKEKIWSSLVYIFEKVFSEDPNQILIKSNMRADLVEL
ncbi:chemerin-like receptor 1 [Discoglossus pictus]